jgi:hypothetical protein
LGIGTGVVVRNSGGLYSFLLSRKPEDLPRSSQEEKTDDGKENGHATYAKVILGIPY